MDSITLATIDQRMQESMGDFLEFTVTTAIAASKVIISTTLNSFDYGGDDFFNNWWIYIKDYANITVERRISDYATATGTLTVYGANLLTDGANVATCQLSRFRRTDRVKAINDAIREIYPALHKRIDNRILITNNFLPNAHFEDWAVSTAPDKWAVSGATIAAVAETTIIRGGTKSMKCTATGGSVYMKLTIANHPRLLDLSGQTVTVKVWAYSSVANDAFIKIYTKDIAGTTQTLVSTTACVANTWTQLVLEDQVLNDDLVDCEIWLFIGTNATVVYFDDARLIGVPVYEYLMPTELDDGDIQQVYIQASGYYAGASETIQLCDSLFGQLWEEVFEWTILNDGANKWLKLASGEISERRIRLIGTAPLTALSAATDTITIDQQRIPMLVSYAEYNFYKRFMGAASSEDISKYERASAKAYAEYMRLSNKKMAVPSRTMRFG